jgi:spore maturation protein CgeB
VRIVIFCHSLISDWNHGNAHFLRGICSELISRGNDVLVYEPEDSWSYQNLLTEQHEHYFAQFKRAYPTLRSDRYRAIDLERMLQGVDVAIVHEWSSSDLISRVGAYRAKSSAFRLLFHDTHHRAVTEPEVIAKLDLVAYDGVLAYGSSLRDIYLRRGWAKRAWVWHEAADSRVFRPIPEIAKTYDLVWIGNWGDNERTGELHEFLIDPVRDLGLKAIVYGVRYPSFARKALEDGGIIYGGWLPNFQVPAAFAQAHITVHIPRRPYIQALAGIPTIRLFEALACGIPLVSAPWQDSEGLFRPGKDLFMVKDGRQMRAKLTDLLTNQCLAESVSRSGIQTILGNHTCSHRVDQLVQVLAELG